MESNLNFCGQKQQIDSQLFFVCMCDVIIAQRVKLMNFDLQFQLQLSDCDM